MPEVKIAEATMEEVMAVRKRRNFTVISMICIISIFISAGTILTGCRNGEENKTEKVIFKIKDYEVGQEQFEYYLAENRSNIISQFQEEQENIDDAFWKKVTEDGRTVSEKLEEAAKDQCTYEYTLLLLAKEKGLADSASFQDIKKDMEKENQRRSDAVERGEVIYGNKEYSMSTYMSYYLSNLTRELIRVMEENELKYTDEQLEQYCIEQGLAAQEGKTLGETYGLAYKTYLLEQYIRQKMGTGYF